MSDIKLHHGDCFKLLDSIADNSIDLILTDIPYVISQENNFTTMKDREVEMVLTLVSGIKNLMYLSYQCCHLN